MGRAAITYIDQNPQGISGMMNCGDRPSVGQAKNCAELLGRARCPDGVLSWKQLSATTWALMNGQAQTGYVVSWHENQAAAHPDPQS